MFPKSFEAVSIKSNVEYTGKIADYILRCRLNLPIENLINFGKLVWNFPSEVILIPGITGCKLAQINL